MKRVARVPAHLCRIGYNLFVACLFGPVLRVELSQAFIVSAFAHVLGSWVWLSGEGPGSDCGGSSRVLWASRSWTGTGRGVIRMSSRELGHVRYTVIFSSVGSRRGRSPGSHGLVSGHLRIGES